MALNKPALAQFTISNGTVDIIGPGLFDYLPGNGNYVDLDGSSSAAGRMTSIALSLIAGFEYTFSFEIAGSQRGDTNTTLAGIDADNDGTLDLVADTITLASNAPLSLKSYTFIPLVNYADARIVFDHEGGDNLGLFLDDVNLTFVPEPSAAAGLFGLVACLIARRRR